MPNRRMVAHATIGNTVLACQGLEMLFALCVRLAFKHRTDTTLENITPLEKNFTKPSMRQLLAELSKYADVAEDFRLKVEDLVERRHVLIHRWGPLHGLPQTDPQHDEIARFAAALSKDANALSDQLHRYFVQWMRRFPDFQQQLSSGEREWLVSPPDLPIEKS